MKTIVAFVSGLIVGSVGIALAAGAISPAAVNGCVYNSTAPTLSNRQQTVFECDVNGKLITH